MEETPIFTFTVSPIPNKAYHYVESSMMFYYDPRESTAQSLDDDIRHMIMQFNSINSGKNMKVTYVKTAGVENTPIGREVHIIPADKFNQKIAFEDFILRHK